MFNCIIMLYIGHYGGNFYVDIGGLINRQFFPFCRLYGTTSKAAKKPFSFILFANLLVDKAVDMALSSITREDVITSSLSITFFFYCYAFFFIQLVFYKFPCFFLFIFVSFFSFPLFFPLGSKLVRRMPGLPHTLPRPCYFTGLHNI